MEMQRLSKHNFGKTLWKALRKNTWARFTTPDLTYITKLDLSPLRSVKFCWCKTSAKIAVNQVQYLQGSSLKRKWVSASTDVGSMIP